MNEALVVTLTDTEWHAVATPDNQYRIRSIASNALEMCCTVPGVIPTSETKAYFSLGGLVNNIVTRPGFQNWIRATVPPSSFLQNETEDEGFDETSALRMAIANMQKNLIMLSTRVMHLEMWKPEAILEWRTINYCLNDRIDRILKIIAGLLENDMRHVSDIFDIKMKFPVINEKINKLKITKLDKDEFRVAIKSINTDIAAITGVDDAVSAKLLEMELAIVQCQSDITELTNNGSAADEVTLNNLTSRVNKLRSDLDTYWELCISLINHTTVEEIETTYANFINSRTIPDDIRLVLDFAYRQALSIVNSTNINQDQIDQLNQIYDALFRGVVIGDQITADELAGVNP